MKKQYERLVYLLLFTFILSAQHSFSQTYASPELKAKTEKKDAEKATRSGIVSAPAVTPVTKEKRAPFDSKLMDGIYRLTKVEAIDHSGKHTEAQMEGYRKEAQREFESRDWGVNPEKSEIYFVRRNNKTNYRIMSFDTKGKTFQVNTCKTCQEQVFEIIEYTPTSLVLEVKPQDAGQYFMYRFSFNK